MQWAWFDYWDSSHFAPLSWDSPFALSPPPTPPSPFPWSPDYRPTPSSLWVIPSPNRSNDEKVTLLSCCWLSVCRRVSPDISPALAFAGLVGKSPVLEQRTSRYFFSWRAILFEDSLLLRFANGNKPYFYSSQYVDSIWRCNLKDNCVYQSHQRTCCLRYWSGLWTLLGQTFAWYSKHSARL